MEINVIQTDAIVFYGNEPVLVQALSTNTDGNDVALISWADRSQEWVTIDKLSTIVKENVDEEEGFDSVTLCDWEWFGPRNG